MYTLILQYSEKHQLNLSALFQSLQWVHDAIFGTSACFFMFLKFKMCINCSPCALLFLKTATVANKFIMPAVWSQRSKQNVMPNICCNVLWDATIKIKSLTPSVLHITDKFKYRIARLTREKKTKEILNYHAMRLFSSTLFLEK